MSVLAGIVGLVGLLCLLVAAVGLIAPSFFKDKKTGEVPKRSHLAMGGVAGSFIAFAVAGALAPDSDPTDQVAKKAVAAAPSEGKPAEVPSDKFHQSVSKLSRDITRVAQVADGEKQVLAIDIKPSSGYSDSSFFFMATEDMNKALSKLVKQLPAKPADRVDFVISTALTDKYGNSQDYQVINLSFDMAELKKINFSGGNFTSWDLLRLANPVKYLHPAGCCMKWKYPALSNTRHAPQASCL